MARIASGLREIVRMTARGRDMKRIALVSIIAIMLITPSAWSEQATGNRLIRPALMWGLVDNAMVPTNSWVINMRRGGLIELDVYVPNPSFPKVEFRISDSNVIRVGTPSSRWVINYGLGDDSWEYAYFFRAIDRGNCTITLEVNGQEVVYQFFVSEPSPR